MVTVTSDRLPVRAEPQISEDLRERGIAVVKGLLVDGKVDQNAFEQALDGLLAVHSEAEFASLMRSLPPPVAVTPPGRQRQEPLEIATSMGEVRLDGRWQVGSLTKIDTGMGAVIVDLTGAEFDDWDVEIVVHTRMGTILSCSPWPRHPTCRSEQPGDHFRGAADSRFPGGAAQRHLRHGRYQRDEPNGAAATTQKMASAKRSDPWNVTSAGSGNSHPSGEKRLEGCGQLDLP